MIRKPSLERQNDKVIILAYGPSMERCPWDDTSFDLYTLNASHRFRVKRGDETVNVQEYASLWFQMHRPGSGKGHIDDPDHRKWLTEWTGCPVLMCEAYPDFPSAVSYPREAVTQNCGPGRDFYASSIDYMVGYALLQGYPEIHLYGCDMGTDEYQARKGSLQYYLGVARGRGVAVMVPEESAVLKHTHVYGYEEEPQANKRLIDYILNNTKDCDYEKAKALDESQTAWGRAREQEGRKKALLDVVEILKMRDNGSTM